MIRRPPISPLFPYTPLSGSGGAFLPAEIGGCFPHRAVVAAANGFHLHRRWKVKETRRLSPGVGVRFAHKAAPNQTDVERASRSEEHTSELQSQSNLVCRLLL